MSEDNPQEPRVGVFVCHCGTNIAGVVDVGKVTEYAKSLPYVAYAEQNRYVCADPGQDLIRKAVKEHNLNRIVVAACSPRLHEPTFRRCISEAGLNPYLFEMANIREFCSWPHPKEPEEATQKAMDIVRMSVARAALLTPLEVFKVPVTNKAMVIGGGVAGIQAAQDLADMWFKVYLVEKELTIGGHMAQLDKCFPTLDCSICILGPKMVEANRHPSIEVMALAEVKKVEGYIGNFKVTVLKKPKYVIEKDCTGCGECVDVCPIEVPNEFEVGLAPRKAIYIPFPQTVPLCYAIDMDHCIECYKCVDACGDLEAINFDMKPEEVELEVGTIIVATGYDVFNPEGVGTYGYGEYPNVITALELERVINAAGPTGGDVIRSSDGEKAKSVAFIQCVGSRDINFNEYCSGFCCMYALKNAVLIKEKSPETDVYICFIDIRAPFKGYEEFYRRARELGVVFIRGKSPEVIEDPETNNLIVKTTDNDLGKLIELNVDLVVLSTAAVPKADADELAKTLHITRGQDGFFLESHLKLKPVDTPVEGVFLAGSCQGPKDITFSVSQGSGAAARAARVLSKKTWTIEPIVAVVDPDRCRNVKAKCGICATRCPYGAPVVEEGEAAKILPALCQGCGTCVADCPSDAIDQMHFTDEEIFSQIRAALSEDPENKILGFLCNWCSYAGADLAGTSRIEYPTNLRAIRTMCSGRIDRDFVLEAFRLGAGIVLASGCHIGDCHYIGGNRFMKQRMETLRRVLEKLGISPERLKIEWFSAAEGRIFAEAIGRMAQEIEEMGVEQIRKENEKARPIIERMLARKGIIEPLAVPKA
ncbi:MAG: CoB-CoM heterodisulfide reductase HdrA2 [Candidatus Bathyarchaeia archaeon]